MPLAGEQSLVRFLRRLSVRQHLARLSDRALLERFINAMEPEAFAALVSRHGPLVYRVCRGVLDNPDDAEDAFQATFLVLSRKAQSVRRRESISSWLFGVAHHCATNLRRSQGRRRHHEHQAGRPAEPDPLSALVVREGQAILDEELARLPEKYRAPLLLCSLQGLTRDEAAQQLGLGVGTLKSRLEQARKRLRLRLAARGLTVSGALVASVFVEQTAGAAIPAGLEAATVQAAGQAAAGSALAPVVRAQVAALAEGVLKAMVVSKVKIAVALVLVGCLIAAGSGFMIARPFAAQDPPAQPDATPTKPVKKTENHKTTPKQSAPVSFHFGEQVRPHFFLKNTGKTPLRMQYPSLIQSGDYKALKFTDSQGRAKAVHEAHQLKMLVGFFALELGPGQPAEVYGDTLGIGVQEGQTEAPPTVLDAKPGQTYAVEFALPNYADRKLGDVRTGKFRFTVLGTRKRRPRPLTSEEMKKGIAWGKPAKNGLQVGVILVPGSRLAASAQDWPVFRGNSLNSGVSNATLPEQLEVLWKFPTQDSVEGTAAIVGGTVYVGSLDSHLYAIDLRTGKQQWSLATGPIKTAIGVRAGLVYVGDEDGGFHCVDAATGKERWKFTVEAAVTSGVSFSGERILFGSQNETLYCLDTTGKELWNFRVPGGPVMGTPAITGGRTFVSGCDSNLHILSTGTGKEVAAVPLDGQTGASVAVQDDILYVGTMSSQVLAIDLAKPAVAWRFESPRSQPFYASAAVTDRLVVVGSRDKRVHALDRRTGKEVWQYATGRKVDSSPVVNDNRIFVGSSDGNLYVLSLEDGKPLQKFPLGRRGEILASPAVGEHCLVIGTRDGNGGAVYCLGAKR